MRKYVLIFIAIASLWSCQTDEQYTDLNIDPKNPSQVSPAFLFTSATVSLSDQMQSPNVNINIFRFIAQYWTATTYLDEPNYDLRTRTIPESHWDEIYQDVLYDLQDAKLRVQESSLSDGEKKARIAQIEVISVYAWQVLVDTFGDIPYSQALQAVEYPQPVYDDDAVIYADLISRLTAARAGLQAGQGFTTADVLYYGDMAKWTKFANSLLLRLGMRISDYDSGLAQSTVDSAISGGVFASNADNAVVAYQSTPPNTNPMWVDLVQSGRSDYVVANTIVDYMVPLNDPRMDTYFGDNMTPYVGGTYGATSSYSTHTHVGDLFHDPAIPGIFMDYAEVQFLLAAAAQEQFPTPMTAEEHYNAAVSASILYWGDTQADADAYLAQTGVAYDGTAVQLATQFWIAMYNNPMQGWSVWRKFDAPQLNVAAQSQLPVPLRYTYPIQERNLNGDNYDAASLAIGGDEQQTPVFWDVIQ